MLINTGKRRGEKPVSIALSEVIQATIKRGQSDQ
jgi:DNA-directed RNA polymerase subunit K/omega